MSTPLKDKKPISRYSRWYHQRSSSLAWLLNFITLNLFVFWIVGLPYFSFFQLPPAKLLTHAGILLTRFYFVISYLGQLAILALLPLSLFLIPFVISFPKRGKLLRLLAATLAASLVGLLIIDMSLYRLYHFHFNGIVLHFILGGGLQEIVGLSSQEYLLLSLLLGLLFLFEYGLAWLCWHKIHLHRWAYFSTLHALAPSCLLLSYLLFFSAAASADSKDNTVLENTHAIVMQATILPLYHNLIATLFPISLTDSMRSGEGMFTQQAQKTHTLYYPQHPLHFSPPTHLPNIVIIGLDAWRFDMMTPEVSPHIYAFSKRCLQFTEHWSGGNGTEPGLFSLFYSLPSTYWSSAIVTGQSPLLIHELSKFGYKLGLFVSAETYSPPYNKTIYREVPHMPTRTPGDEPYQRDAYITHAFDQFIKQQDHQHPFFSFVFYNTTHSYCTANPYPHVFLPQTEECNRLQLDNDFDPTPFRNRYKNAVHYVDGLVGQVLLTLEKNHQLDNTLVLILGDHGEEFNDNHTDAWGHAGNFTRYQLQTPLLIYWPGKSPQRYTHQTTHFDIVPTLFNHVFNCKNPSQDYSIGHDLFDSNPRPYIVVGSYIDFGIVEKGRITRILPGGNLEILDDHSQLLSAKPSIEIVKQAFGDTQRFYHI